MTEMIVLTALEAFSISREDGRNDYMETTPRHEEQVGVNFNYYHHQNTVR